jgi:hypothetical protein
MQSSWNFTGPFFAAFCHLFRLFLPIYWLVWGCVGQMGVVLGVQSIPPELIQECLTRGRWNKPFNDTYINHGRDGLPNYIRISDIVERSANIAETAMVQEGGNKKERDEQIVNVILR